MNLNQMSHSKHYFTYLDIKYDNGTGSHFPLPLSEYAQKLLIKRIESGLFKKIIINIITEPINKIK